MHTVCVQEVNGSLIIAVPREVAEELNLKAGTEVQLQAEGKGISLAARRSRYRLQDLLAQCDFTQPVSREEQEWMSAPSVGRELLS